MTFSEAEQILKDLRTARRRVNAIKARIEELESDRECISSALGVDRVSGGKTNVSRVEQLAIRIETEREKQMQALEKYFEIEDKLTAAIEYLDEIEKEIIIEFYVSGFPIWKIAGNISYSEPTIKRRKSRAISKIAQNL